MRNLAEQKLYKEFSDEKNAIMQIWENQHPVMYWWYALTSISFFSVYIILFTKL